MELGLRLRHAMRLHPQYRVRGGQKELAKAARVDPGNLSRMVRGRGGSEVTAGTIGRLARALDVTAGYLMGDGSSEPVRASMPRSITPDPSSSITPKSA